MLNFGGIFVVGVYSTASGTSMKPPSFKPMDLGVCNLAIIGAEPLQRSEMTMTAYFFPGRGADVSRGPDVDNKETSRLTNGGSEGYGGK